VGRYTGQEEDREIGRGPVSEELVRLQGRWASTTALLADAACRSILATLGHAETALPLSAIAGPQRTTAATRRLIRDRLRDLERIGAVHRHVPPNGNSRATATWRLTPAGRELHSLLDVISRIVDGAAGLTRSDPPEARERALEMTLKGVSDPIVVQICRRLADGSCDAGELERACRPTPRRTLYRRLEPLVAAGVLERRTTHEVPRRSFYRIADRWRPVAAVLVLGAWWEWRHGGAPSPELAEGVERLIATILPLVTPPAEDNGARLRWIITSPGNPPPMTLQIEDGALRLASDAAPDGPVDAEVSGRLEDWASALVTGDSSGMAVTGDEKLARRIGATIRRALLAHLRGTAKAEPQRRPTPAAR